MRNIRKFCSAIIIGAIICCAFAIEISPAEAEISNDDTKLRWPRRTKKTESTSESVKKQKQQQQEDSESLTRSQLTNSPTVNSLNGLATIQTSVEPMRNILQNVPLQMRQMDGTFNNMGMNNYALNYPYQGYPTQSIPTLGNQGYLYGNPNVQPVDQTTNNLIGQQPMPDFINGQQFYPNNYAPNYMGYGAGHPGLIQPGKLPFPPVYGNNLIGYGPFPGIHNNIGMSGIQNNLGTNGEIFGKPVIPPGYPITHYPSGSVTGVPPVGTVLPGEVSSTGQTTQLPQIPQPPQMSQPSILNPILGLIPFGPPLQNGLHNGFNGGIFPDFIRNQRSLEESNEK